MLKFSVILEGNILLGLAFFSVKIRILKIC